jgi:hypothetical protein
VTPARMKTELDPRPGIREHPQAVASGQLIGRTRRD